MLRLHSVFLLSIHTRVKQFAYTVDVTFQINIPESGPATIVPFVASTIIDEVEITLPAIVAGGDVPTISNIDLGSAPATVRYVETFPPV